MIYDRFSKSLNIFYHVKLHLGGDDMEWLKKLSQSIDYIENNSMS